MADAISGATLVTIADCGHVSSLERPEAVNAALRRWLGVV
jgi:pimeloyl-ACP methyl ester carboxylesterase